MNNSVSFICPCQSFGCCDEQIIEILRKTFPDEWQPPEPDLKDIERQFKFLHRVKTFKPFRNIRKKKVRVEVEYEKENLKLYFYVSRGSCF